MAQKQNLTLWDEKYLAQFTVPHKKTLAEIAREEVVKYGVENAELAGLIVTLVGEIPDEAINELLSRQLPELVDMSEAELCRIPGMTKVKARKLAAAFELARRLASVISDAAKMERERILEKVRIIKEDIPCDFETAEEIYGAQRIVDRVLQIIKEEIK